MSEIITTGNEGVLVKQDNLSEQLLPELDTTINPEEVFQEEYTGYVEQVETSAPVLYYEAVYDAVYDAVMASNLDETVTDGQTVNNTALSYFEGILGNQMLPVDYVVYTGSQYTYYANNYTERTAYEYCMMYGDLTLEGETFTGEDVTIVRIRTSGDVSVNYETASAASVTAPMYYSKSNMGAYSGIIQYDWTGVMLLLCFLMGGLIWFIQEIMCLKR